MAKSKVTIKEKIDDELDEKIAIPVKKAVSSKAKSSKAKKTSKSIDVDDASKKVIKSDEKELKSSSTPKTRAKAKANSKSKTKTKTEISTKNKKDAVDKVEDENKIKMNSKADVDVETKIQEKKTRTSSDTEKKSNAKVNSESKTKNKKSSNSKVKIEVEKNNVLENKKSVAKPKAIKEIEDVFVDIPEYYDLPYKYEKTVVKVLYQNPNTLFVYWDISDDDINQFKKTYGENFFYITKPILVIHNITDGYSFEIEVNDFANNWYIHVSDAKCKYNVQLARRPSQDNSVENIIEHKKDDFVNISYSNTIEMPNDHVLFFKDHDKIYFKNIKTNKITEKTIDLKRDSDKINGIYNNYDLSKSDDRFDFKNPSSQNPTSNVMKSQAF